MALKDCIKTIRDAAPSLSKTEALDLLDEVNDIIDAKKESAAAATVVDLDAELSRITDDLASFAEREAVNKKRMKALTFLSRTKRRQEIEKLKLADLPDYIDALAIGQSGDSRFKTSAASVALVVEKQALTIYARGLELRGVPRSLGSSFLRKEKNSALLFREIDAPGSTGNPTAKAVAEAMEDTNEFLRKLANKYGADIGRIPGYLAKQAHNADRMVKSGVKDWVAKILPLLDEERTFGRPMTTKQKKDFLSDVYSTIVKGKQSDLVSDTIDLTEVPGLKGPGNIGKKLSSRRTLHFKQDGVSAWSYMQEFGSRDLGTGFVGGLNQMSKAIGAMQRLGPNPKAMMHELVEFAKNRIKADKSEASIGILNKLNNITGTDLKKTNALFLEATGGAGILPSVLTWRGKLARSLSFTKNVSSSSVLGLVTLTSVGDFSTSTSAMTNIGIPFLQAHGDLLAGVFKGRRSGREREVADSMLVGIDSMTSSVHARFLGNDIGDSQGAGLVSKVMDITGMNWLNDTLKTSVGLTVGNYIAKQKGKSWGGIDPQLKRAMAGYGIDEAQFKLITDAADDVEGKVFVDIEKISDPNVAQKFQEFIVGFTNRAILTPDARTHAFTRNALGTGERGDVLTEIGALFFHVKSFSIAYGTEILSRVYSKGQGIRLGYPVHLFVSSLVYGYISTSLHDFVKGKTFRDPTLPSTWAKSLLQSGGLGFYGDILTGYIKDDDRQGVGLLENAAGPAFGVFVRSAKGLKQLYEGDTDRAMQEGFRAVKSSLPGANIFYAKLALDYMIFWQMAEYLKPGFARRFERRMKEETGQEFNDFASPTGAVR